MTCLIFPAVKYRAIVNVLLGKTVTMSYKVTQIGFLSLRLWRYSHGK